MVKIKETEAWNLTAEYGSFAVGSMQRAIEGKNSASLCDENPE